MSNDAKKWFVTLITILVVAFVPGCQDNGRSNDPEGKKSNGLEFYSVPYTRAADGSYMFNSTGSPALGVNDSMWTVTWNVTPNGGGTLSLLNSNLYVPPGAVSSSTRITWMLRTTVPPGLPNALNRVYEFGPDGTEFEKPATLRVTFADAGLGKNQPEQYKFYHYVPTTNRWVPQRTEVDAANRQFVVRLSHFSIYAFGR